MKRFKTTAVAALAAVTLAGLVPAAQAQDNAAVAVNTKDGTTLFRIAFKIARVNKDVVDNANAAVAWASCTECQAIAVAFQIVLVFSDPSVVTPTNLALGVNWECTACVAFADAHQWVLGTGGNVHFTPEGNQRLAEVRKRLHELRTEDLTLDELRAILEEIEAEIDDILANELVPAGQQQEESDETDTAETTTEPTTTETTPTTTTEPTTTETVP